MTTEILNVIGDRKTMTALLPANGIQFEMIDGKLCARILFRHLRGTPNERIHEIEDFETNSLYLRYGFEQMEPYHLMIRGSESYSNDEVEEFTLQISLEYRNSCIMYKSTVPKQYLRELKGE